MLCRRSPMLLMAHGRSGLVRPTSMLLSTSAPTIEVGNPTPPSKAADSKASAAATSVQHERIANIFANRRNPTNLFQPGMHSGTLSDHPITLKVAKDELDYRQRKLVERGEYEKAVEAEMEAEAKNLTTKDGFKESNEYRWALFFVALGYFTAHLVVYSYYYPDDMRLPYDPERGYIDSIERQNTQMEATDAFVGSSVMEGVFDAKRALLKSKAEKQWATLSGATVTA